MSGVVGPKAGTGAARRWGRCWGRRGSVSSLNAADFAPAEEGVQGNEVEDGAQVHRVFFLSQAALPMRARHLDLLAEGGRWLADDREVRTDRVH